MVFRAATPNDFSGILAIQTANLRTKVTTVTAAREGYVTAVHTQELLQLLNTPVPHIVVVSPSNEVLGYALSMSPQHRNAVAILKPMFIEFERRKWKGELISSICYTVMGQVALAPSLRGKGAFRKLYTHWCAAQAAHFALGLTEIEAGNLRSLNAHLAIGWTEFGRYTQEDLEWILVGKDLREL